MGDGTERRDADAADLETALRRVVYGFRVVALVWMGVLALAAAAGGRAGAPAVAATLLPAAAWTAASVVLLARPGPRPGWGLLTADVGVTAWVVMAPALLFGEESTFFGGYPFSTVLVTAWARGLPGALPAAALLAAATLGRLAVLSGGGPGGPATVDTAVFYLVGAATLSWGIGVLRRTDAERRAAAAALAAERAERALAEQRAETAAHLHDSVLQTLALIQRRSDAPAEVTTLARRQERDLRDWLSGRGPGAGGPGVARFAAAVADMAAAVEATHHCTVEVVTSGDAEVDADLEALVAAAREAVVNAARHAEVARVSVYAEVTADRAAVYVRDRGVGFDPAAVAADRRGISESIRGRIGRHAGTADIRSTPGAGTEVELAVPRGRPGEVS
jgi:signal transduction histidine kinase